jgi:hypothetical protein
MIQSAIKNAAMMIRSAEPKPSSEGSRIVSIMYMSIAELLEEAQILFDLKDVPVNDVLSVDKAGLIEQSGQGAISKAVVQAMLRAILLGA